MKRPVIGYISFGRAQAALNAAKLWTKPAGRNLEATDN